MTLVNSGRATDSVFWQVGSSATLGTDTAFAGNVLALTRITLTTGASNPDGRILASNGAVTLDTNTVGVVSNMPEPTAFSLLLVEVLALIVHTVRQKKSVSQT